MGVFEDFSKLHISIKSVVLSIISIFPFYFISLYLFQKSLINPYLGTLFYINDFKVLFIFSICLSLSLAWVVSNVCLSVAISYFAEKMTDEQHDEEVPFILTFIYSLFYLGSCIIVNYMIVKTSFINFVFLSYIFLIVRFLWTFVWYQYWKVKHKNN